MSIGGRMLGSIFVGLIDAVIVSYDGGPKWAVVMTALIVQAVVYWGSA